MKSKICMFAIIPVIAVGCDTPDERLVNQLADTSQQVVQQNQEIAKTQHEIAAGSKRLVEAVAESRHEHYELQRDLQEQRDKLEGERTSIAAERRTESLLAPVLSNGGLLLIAVLPLVLAGYLLHGLRTPDEDMSQVLICEIVADSQPLLSSRAAREIIEHRETVAGKQDPEPPF